MTSRGSLEQARRSLRQGDLPSVRDALKRFWAAAPSAQGYADLVAYCLEAGRPDLAGNHLHSLLASDAPAEMLHPLGVQLAEQGHMPEAELLLARGVALRPDAVECWSDLGAIRWHLGKRSEAIACAKRALALDPSHPDALANLSALRGEARTRRYRILCLGDAGSVHTQRFVRYFAEAGHDVHLLSDKPADLPGVQVYAPDGGIPVLQFATWMGICQHVIRVVKPDFVHGHYASIYGLWGALSGFRPYVLTMWGSDINVDPHLAPNYKALVRYALAQADILMGDSSDLNEAAKQLAVTPIATPSLVRFGVDTEQFRPGLPAEDLRAHYQLGSGPVVFSPRQFKPPANIHRIIEAIPYVLERFPEAIFVLKTYATPRDEYYHQLVNLAATLGVSETIRFVEEAPHDEMPLWYNLARVTLSIRDVDAGSVSVMESLACGTPVIGSDIPSNQELIDSQSGRLVNPHDVRALAGAILAVLEDEACGASMGQHGRSEMIGAADFEVNMAQVEHLYDQLWALREEAQSGHRGDLAALQSLAILQVQAGHPAQGHRTLERAVAMCQSPWDGARILATAELIEHPNLLSEENRNQTALSEILAHPEGRPA